MSELNKKLIDYGGLEHFRDMLLNDSSSATGSTWSSNKINTELSGYATTSAMTSGLAAKQDTLTAGSNITISGNTISATDTTYSAGSGITISGNSVSVDSNLLSEINGKQDELTAGTNITISGTTIIATYETASTAEIEALFS